jgi:hypothetical protein
MRNVQRTAWGEAAGAGGVQAGSALFAGLATAANAPGESGVIAVSELSVGTWGWRDGAGRRDDNWQQERLPATARKPPSVRAAFIAAMIMGQFGAQQPMPLAALIAHPYAANEVAGAARNARHSARATSLNTAFMDTTRCQCYPQRCPPEVMNITLGGERVVEV